MKSHQITLGIHGTMVNVNCVGADVWRLYLQAVGCRKEILQQHDLIVGQRNIL